MGDQFSDGLVEQGVSNALKLGPLAGQHQIQNLVHQNAKGVQEKCQKPQNYLHVVGRSPKSAPRILI